jgi:hypothetical protein
MKAISETMMTAMMEQAASGAFDVRIVDGTNLAGIFDTGKTEVKAIVYTDTQTCNCATFAAWTICPHVIAVNRELAVQRMVDLHDSAEAEGGVDPYAEY